MAERDAGGSAPEHGAGATGSTREHAASGTSAAGTTSAAGAVQDHAAGATGSAQEHAAGGASAAPGLGIAMNRASERLGTDHNQPWLLVIDPQRIFAHPASDWASPFFPAAMERIREAATAVGPTRTLVTRWLPTADRTTAWGDYFAAWPFADVPAEDPLYELVEDARSLSSRPTIDEPTFGKWGPQLAGLVGAAPRIWVAGVSTDCCVVATVLAAADAGAHITVLTDAVAASSAENGRAALDVMALFPPQVRLRTTAEALAAIPPDDPTI